MPQRLIQSGGSSNLFCVQEVQHVSNTLAEVLGSPQSHEANAWIVR
jgi:hypothetical protein